MSLLIESTRTSSSTAFTTFKGAEPKFNFTKPGNTLPQQSVTGTRMLLSCGYETLKGAEITPYEQTYLQNYENLSGVLLGCGLLGGVQYLSLVDLPLREDLAVQYRKLPSTVWPDQLSGVVVLGYTSNAAAATGFIVNSVAISATNTKNSTSLYSGEFACVTPEVLSAETRKLLVPAEFEEFEGALSKLSTHTASGSPSCTFEMPGAGLDEPLGFWLNDVSNKINGFLLLKNWDSYRASPVVKETVSKALVVASQIASMEPASGRALQTKPLVGPMGSGGILFELRQGSRELQIEVFPGKTREYGVLEVSVDLSGVETEREFTVSESGIPEVLSWLFQTS